MQELEKDTLVTEHRYFKTPEGVGLTVTIKGTRSEVAKALQNPFCIPDINPVRSRIEGA